jgi:hypothetical protein
MSKATNVAFANATPLTQSTSAGFTAIWKSSTAAATATTGAASIVGIGEK